MSSGGARAEGTPAAADHHSETITRLFPKCRPKSMHHHHAPDDPDDRLILNAKGSQYKLRDSRIIEIAGGREVYSASRAKAVRKLRHGASKHGAARTKPRPHRDTPPQDNNTSNEIAIHRINNEPKRMISRHTSPSYTNGSREMGPGIPRNSSPVLDPHRAPPAAPAPPPGATSSPIAVVAGGEVLVLDTNQHWPGLRADEDEASDEEEMDVSVHRTIDNIQNGDGDCDNKESEGSEESAWSGGAARVARVIGSLPIAQYEGSPRRIGHAPSTPAPAPAPRPGHPQRVLPESPPPASTFDYMYEFSETRKVLEEFFRCPAAVHQNANDEIVNFQELDYELRRSVAASAAGAGGGGVCAGEGGDTRGSSPLSPYIPNNHTNFLGLPASPAAGAGRGVERRGEPFALSSESSDSGSASDLSLVHMEDDITHMKVQMDLSRLSDSCRLPVSKMPVVADGLSSLEGSDGDNNNQTQSSGAEVADGVGGAGGVEGADTRLLTDAELHSLDPLVCVEAPPPPPAPAPHRPADSPPPAPLAPHAPHAPHTPHAHHDDVYPPRKRPSSAQSTESVEIKQNSGDEEEADTDLETDRLLGQQRTDDHGFYDDKGWRKPKSRTVLPAGGGGGGGGGGARSPPHDTHNGHDNNTHNGKDKDGKKKTKSKEVSVLIEGVLFRARYLGSTQLACEGQPTKATRMLQAEEAVSRIKWGGGGGGGGVYSGVYAAPAAVFRLAFLGSVEVDEDTRRRKKRPKKNMVEEAVNKIKALAPEGESQPSTEVDLFISTEKIMVLNTELKEIMMDHALRTISYIADIGELVVLMARRRFVPHDTPHSPPHAPHSPHSPQHKLNRTPKMICHVFESEEAQFIAQSIGQAFQVAYMEFLKANGIEDHSFVKEMDYQEVLNSQEIFGDELQMFAKKELQKEVVVPKAKGEILGVVVVESGWGSMLPTVVIANLAPAGAAARCGHLNIGDQIIAINGVSLVGLPLSTCQTYIKNSKGQTVVKLTVVPCAPVVEVKIKRPDTKYQLGFSVQNGVICSLLRGGIAERGGVRVGHRIIEINSQSVVAVPHERIVNLLATSVGEILMKTMPTSMFRLLTGQENPVFI